jgi:hypothetical protein
MVIGWTYFYLVLGPPLVTFNPEPPLSTELSTIPESDLSGISRHLSRDSDVSGNRHSKNSEVLPPPSPEINEVSALDTSVLDLSMLDLSTSQLKEEVMHALKEKPSKNGWLTGVVVEDAIDSLPARRNGHEEREEDYAQVEPEESFNLGALDPDLAALLSLNRMRGKQTILLITTENPPPLTTLTPQQPQAVAPPDFPACVSYHTQKSAIAIRLFTHRCISKLRHRVH